MKLHSCFGEDGQLQVFDVWESQEAFDDFLKYLGPVMEELGIELAQPPTVMPMWTWFSNSGLALQGNIGRALAYEVDRRIPPRGGCVTSSHGLVGLSRLFRRTSLAHGHDVTSDGIADVTLLALERLTRRSRGQDLCSRTY